MAGKTPADFRRAAKKQYAVEPVPFPGGKPAWAIFDENAVAATAPPSCEKPRVPIPPRLHPLEDAMMISPVQLPLHKRNALRAERAPSQDEPGRFALFHSPSGPALAPAASENEDLYEVVRDITSVLGAAIADSTSAKVAASPLRLAPLAAPTANAAQLQRAQELAEKRRIREEARARKEAAAAAAREEALPPLFIHRLLTFEGGASGIPHRKPK